MELVQTHKFYLFNYTAKSGRLNQNWYRPEPEWNRSESECVYRSVSVQMGNDMYQSVGLFLYQSDTVCIQSVSEVNQSVSAPV